MRIIIGVELGVTSSFHEKRRDLYSCGGASCDSPRISRLQLFEEEHHGSFAPLCAVGELRRMGQPGSPRIVAAIGDPAGTFATMDCAHSVRRACLALATAASATAIRGLAGVNTGRMRAGGKESCDRLACLSQRTRVRGSRSRARIQEHEGRDMA